jgi:hypothetical protein
MGFKKVFGELFWAATKTLAIVLTLTAIQLGFTFNNTGLGNDWFDSYGGAFLLMFLGFVLSFPMLFFMILFVGTPASMLIIKKGWINLYVFILCGAFISFVFFNGMKFLSAEKTFTLKDLVKENSTFVLAGGLTGFLFYKLIENNT